MLESSGGRWFLGQIFSQAHYLVPKIKQGSQKPITKVSFLTALWVFLPWCCLCRIPQRRGGSEDICLSWSGSVHDSCMVKPHCLPSAWRGRWCTSPAHAEAASSPVTCPEISNCSGLLGKESHAEASSSRDELPPKHWFHENSSWIQSVVSFKGWNTLQWLEHVELGSLLGWITGITAVA